MDHGLIPRDVQGGPGQSVGVLFGYGYSCLRGALCLHFMPPKAQTSWDKQEDFPWVVKDKR